MRFKNITNDIKIKIEMQEILEEIQEICKKNK